MKVFVLETLTKQAPTLGVPAQRRCLPPTVQSRDVLIRLLLDTFGPFPEDVVARALECNQLTNVQLTHIHFFLKLMAEIRDLHLPAAVVVDVGAKPIPPLSLAECQWETLLDEAPDDRLFFLHRYDTDVPSGMAAVCVRAGFVARLLENVDLLLLSNRPLDVFLWRGRLAPVYDMYATTGLALFEDIPPKRDASGAMVPYPVPEKWLSTTRRGYRLQVVDPDTLVGKFTNYNGSLFVRTPAGRFTPYLESDGDACCCVYRSDDDTKHNPPLSTTRFTELDPDLGRAKLQTHAVLFEQADREDPRVACVGGRALVSFTTGIQYLNMRPLRYQSLMHKLVRTRIAAAWLDDPASLVTFELNRKQPIQKNWGFFDHGGVLHVLYTVMPLAVHAAREPGSLEVSADALGGGHEWAHPTDPEMRLRGGAPPVLVDGVYYAFVHSVKYETVCVAFSGSTWKVLGATGPLTDPSIRITFPCGVVYDVRRAEFLVSMGIDDTHLAILRVPKRDVDAALTPVNDY